MSLPSDLPIYSILPDLRNKMLERQAVILSAPPGSGKTTIVPIELLEESWLKGKSILILEPRRLAARMAAWRMAEILEQPVGRTVGYRVRFDSKVSDATRIEVVTEGILTRRMQKDPELSGVGLVIFDEFHERSLHGDLALALCLDVIDGLREDLKILIMSATLDVESIISLLGDSNLVQGKGREYPVNVLYLEDEVPKRGLAAQAENVYSFPMCVNRMSKAIHKAVHEEEGDILAFLPGMGEIRQTAEQLDGLAREEMAVVYPLHGNLPKKMQDKAVLPDRKGKRRIVLATSIAETSLTIEGVRVVIDSGWSRVQRFDPNSGLSRLTTVRISKASAEQRRGRAGRLAPGVCYRLWDKRVDRELPAYSRPEILDADLAWFVLELAHWGVIEPGALKWLDSPPAGHFSQAVELLSFLGALDDKGRITDMGKRMAMLPVHPRIARMLLFAEDSGSIKTACDLAALLSERDIFRHGDGPVSADIESRLQILDAFRKRDRKMFHARYADNVACSVVDRTARQFRRMTRKKSAAGKKMSAGALLAAAYPDRIAQLRLTSHDRYLLANGSGARLPGGDHLASTPYLVVADVDAARTEGRIYLAASLSEDELYDVLKDSIHKVENVSWDNREEKVLMALEDRLQKLVLNRRPLEQVDPEVIRQTLLQGIRQMGLDVLPWTKEAKSLQARILLLREHQPDIAWPDCSNSALMGSLEEWLAPYLDGMTNRGNLAGLDLASILRNKLDWRMQKLLEEFAPTHLRVPSGTNKRLLYEVGSPPVLAVRLQEMFGLEDTPSLCRNRVKVVLHLLSPAQRPIQITQDLKGFWRNTYPEIKKELKGRYPKHYWPDDPLSAKPTARVKPGRL